MHSLIGALKRGDSQEVRRILRAGDKAPAESILPFVLRKCLRKERLHLDDIRYVKDCFRMFSDLRCLDVEDQRRCAETHRVAMVTEAVCLMDEAKDYLSAGSEVAVVLKEFVGLYKDDKLADQITYFVLACNRRTRFARVKSSIPKMRECLEKRLRRRALRLVENFIRRM